MKNPMNTHLVRQGLAMLGAALLCITATSVLAVTIAVTNTNNSGGGSLRAALASLDLRVSPAIDEQPPRQCLGRSTRHRDANQCIQPGHGGND